MHKGESLATFYGAADKFEAAAAEYRSGLVYGAEKPEEAPLVYALVTKDGVERYLESILPARRVGRKGHFL